MGREALTTAARRNSQAAKGLSLAYYFVCVEIGVGVIVYDNSGVSTHG